MSPSSATLEAIGGTATVNLTATTGCSWREQADAAWVVSVSPAEGSGSAAVRFSVGPNAGAPRTATLRIGEAVVGLSQAGAGAPAPPPPSPTPPPPGPTPSPAPTPAPPACRYAVSPARADAKSSGGQAVVEVSTDPGCAWVATTSDSWIAITSGASSSGSGSVRLAIGANTGAARSGVVIVAGKTVAVEQEGAPAPCTYRLTPDSRNIGADGGDFSVAVATQASCAWTASSEAAWITITDARSGTGSGTFVARIAANTGGARSGVIRVGSETLTVQQAGRTCSYGIKPTYYDAGRGPDDIRVNVTAPSGCAWTATSPAPWATISEGRSGSGQGVVRILVEANSGAERTAELTIAGEAFRLKQLGCAATIKPTHYDAGRGPDDIRITVKADNGCSWTASSSVSWVRVAEGASGSGDGTVRLLVEANSGPDREVTLTIASQPFQLKQNGSR